MKKQLSHTIGGVYSLLLLFASADAWACGSTSITNLPGLGGTVITPLALGASGQVGGSATLAGDQVTHAFIYSTGAATDLGTLGGSFSQVLAVNASGWAAGYASIPNDVESHAFLYNGTGLLDLGTLGGTLSSATALNNSNQVAGYSNLAGDAEQQAFLYSGGSLAGLGNLGGPFSSAIAINNSGAVIGVAYNAGMENRGFLYANGTMVDLGDLGFPITSPAALNDAGIIVGESGTPSTDTHAFSYSSGVMTDLGTLGGSFSSALGINNSNQIIGISTTVDGNTSGFICSNGSMTDLGNLGGSPTLPAAVNNPGQIVGSSEDTNGNTLAFLWQNGAMVDLNTLLPANSGWVLSNAQFINDAGRIVGTGTYNGTAQWFVLDLSSGNGNPPVAQVTMVPAPGASLSCQTSVTLDASGSSNPGGGALTWQWSENGSVLGTNSTLTGTFDTGQHTINLKVTNPCNASAETNIVFSVTDTTLPTVTAPHEINASADANCQAAVPNMTTLITAQDNCTPSSQLVISQNPVAGTLVSSGHYVITMTVTDTTGNSASAQTMFNVVDTTPPIIVSLPAPSTVPAGDLGLGSVPDVAAQTVASDSCTPANALKITQTPCAGARVGLGTHTIVVVVKDAAGNAATSSTSFMVVDLTAPRILFAPSHLSAAADSNCQAAVPDVLKEVIAIDNCTPVSQLVKSQTPAAGTIVNHGSNSITITVTDAAGNVASRSIPFQVLDKTAPKIQSLTATPSTISATMNSQPNPVPVTISVMATDNCDPAPVSKIVRVTSSDSLPGEFQITGDLTLKLAPVAHTSKQGRTYTITVRCIDASGNCSDAQVTVSAPPGSGN